MTVPTPPRKVSEAILDVAIILVPMLVTLLLIIFFPGFILPIPRLFMPKFV